MSKTEKTTTDKRANIGGPCLRRKHFIWECAPRGAGNSVSVGAGVSVVVRMHTLFDGLMLPGWRVPFCPAGAVMRQV